MPNPEPNRSVPDPAARPTRIILAGQVLIASLLLASFTSGLLIWRGKYLQMETAEPPDWLHSMVVLHGCLYPILSILFGYLLCQHIRIGWQMRANIVSGFVMEAAFAGLILTGAGLYYVGSEIWRERLGLVHRVCGVGLPAGLAWHWISGLLWAGKLSGKPIIDTQASDRK